MGDNGSSDLKNNDPGQLNNRAKPHNLGLRNKVGMSCFNILSKRDIIEEETLIDRQTINSSLIDKPKTLNGKNSGGLMNPRIKSKITASVSHVFYALSNFFKTYFITILLDFSFLMIRIS